MAAGRIATQVLTWGITIVVMRLLVPGDYGIMAIAMFVGNFVGMISEVGLGQALIQAPKVDDNVLRRVFGSVLMFNSAAFGILLLAAFPIARFFEEPRLTAVLQFMAFEFLIWSFVIVPDALLQRAMQQKRRVVIDFTASILQSVITLILAYSGAGVWALAIGSVTLTAMRAVGLNIVSPFLRWPLFDVARERRLLKFGSNVMLSRLLWVFYSQADVLIAGKMLGKEALGFYSVGLHIASLPVQRLSSILNQVGFAAFSLTQHRPEKVKEYYLLSLRTVSMVAFPVLWGIACVAPELVRSLLGAKWDGAIFPLQVMAGLMPLRMIGTLTSPAVDGVGRAEVNVKNIGLACMVVPPALLLGSHWGITGLCIAWMLALPPIFLLNLSRSLSVLGLALSQALNAISRPALTAAGMWLVVEMVGRLLSAPADSVLRLAVLIAVGACTYALSAVVFNRPGVKELMGLVTNPK
jgi:O-antigen/teichoic acid export membrane protein